MDISLGLAQFGLDAARAGKTAAAANAAQSAARSGNEARARAVAEDFESMFITTMLENMGRDVQNGDGFFGGGHGETMFRGILNEQYGKEISKAGGIGIADSIYRFILQAQEV